MQSLSQDCLAVSPLCWWECIFFQSSMCFWNCSSNPFWVVLSSSDLVKFYPPSVLRSVFRPRFLGAPTAHSGAPPRRGCPSLASCLGCGDVSCCWNFDLSLLTQGIVGLFGLSLPVLGPGTCLMWEVGDITGFSSTAACTACCPMSESPVSDLCPALQLLAGRGKFPEWLILSWCQALY